MSYVSEMRSMIGHQLLLLAGANIVMTNSEGHILLQQRNDLSWGLPGGLLEPGESLEQTAIREVKEETNLDVQTLQFLRVFSGADYTFTLPNRDEINVITALYHTDCWSGEMIVDTEEGLALEFFSPEQLPSPINDEYLTYIRYFLETKAAV